MEAWYMVAMEVYNQEETSKIDRVNTRGRIHLKLQG